MSKIEDYKEFRKQIGVYIVIILLLLLYIFSDLKNKKYKKIIDKYSKDKLSQRDKEYLKNIEVPPPPVLVSLKDIDNPQRIVVMGWNVENLFDTENDPYTDDDEFTPYGRKKWTKKVLAKKIYNLTDIIRRVNNGAGPDILGLCEVENRKVLKMLCNHPNIKKLRYNYQYLKNGGDPRGIDVAIASRYPADYVKYHWVYRAGRFILEAKFTICNQSLYVLVNHWRSRLGGKAKSEFRRIQAAKKCYSIVRKILKKDRKADIVILGDFNDTPYDKSIIRVLRAVPYKGRVGRAILYNLTIQSPFYMDSPFDQIIVSKGLFDKIAFSYIPFTCRIIAFPFMRDRFGKPLPFYPKYGVGYSDHFPIMVSLKINK